jgi:N-methylhydantoinase A
MEEEARAALVREFNASDVLFERHAEMRYTGQRHNIKVPISGLDDAAGMREAFDRDYKRRYGHADAKATAELQALHLSAFTRLRRPELAWLPRAQASPRPPERRPVYFGPAGGAQDTAIYDRTTLVPGFAAAGPALIEEYGSTTLVWPRDRFEIGALGEIRIQCGRG